MPRTTDEWDVMCFIPQGWLAPVDGDVYKARCLYCRVMFRAHAKDLKDHARTSKHATNVAFGVPCSASNAEFELSESTPHRRTLSRQRLPHPKKCSRFGRWLDCMLSKYLSLAGQCDGQYLKRIGRCMNFTRVVMSCINRSMSTCLFFCQEKLIIGNDSTHIFVITLIL